MSRGFVASIRIWMKNWVEWVASWVIELEQPLGHQYHVEKIRESCFMSWSRCCFKASYFTPQWILGVIALPPGLPVTRYIIYVAQSTFRGAAHVYMWWGNAVNGGFLVHSTHQLKPLDRNALLLLLSIIEWTKATYIFYEGWPTID